MRDRWKWLTLVFALISATGAGSATSTNRTLAVVARDPEGQSVSILYERSYALVVGVSNYSDPGWSKLPSVTREARNVAEALRANGFEVTVVYDPDAATMKKAFDDFVNQYGYEPGNRLLFFFSGHGYSLKSNAQGGNAGYGRASTDMGYIVPADAPSPRKNMPRFLSRALSMSQIQSWCEQMMAKHVLFVFDSCFSGTIFKTRAAIDEPPHISELTAKSVRQFITAGDAKEEVPSQSVFTPCFIRGLAGAADLSRDGFITGTELGIYLHDKVVDYRTGQTPQFGKIRNIDLDEGDFVFATSGTSVPPEPERESRLPSGFSPVGNATDPASGLPMRIRHEKTGIELALVPSGEFSMGYEGIATPVHNVYLDAYYIGVTEVSNAQYRRFQSSHNSGDHGSHSLNGDNQPVVMVSWNDAKSFCDWAALTLPTEAQWEKAARGTDGRKYPWGNQWPPSQGAGNFADMTAINSNVLALQIEGYNDGHAVTSPVGSFSANEPYGMKDMAGNVWEWCDGWFGDYPSGTVRNPAGPNSGTNRVLRGASWSDYNASVCAASYRIRQLQQHGG